MGGARSNQVGSSLTNAGQAMMNSGVAHNKTASFPAGNGNLKGGQGQGGID